MGRCFLLGREISILFLEADSLYELPQNGELYVQYTDM